MIVTAFIVFKLSPVTVTVNYHINERKSCKTHGHDPDGFVQRSRVIEKLLHIVK